MNINSQNNTSAKLINTAAIGIAGGEAAKLVHYHFLSDSAKFAFNNARKSQDTFIAEAVACAKESIQNVQSPGLKSKISIEAVKENAKNMYPEVAETGKKVLKSVTKTGMIAAAGFTALAALAHFVIAPKVEAKKQVK